MANKLEDNKICIVGLGGVGGFLGGCLAKKYPHVSFYVRGGRKEAIKEKGLIVRSELLGDFRVNPEICSDNSIELGSMDFIFVCVKDYSLEEICSQISPMITDKTVIIPVMNGIDPAERTRELLQNGIVIDSLIYIVSGSNPDYSIIQRGNFAKIHLGRMNPSEEEMKAVRSACDILYNTGVECFSEDDIEAAVWKKYILNCAFNVLTAYYSTDIGELRKDPKKVQEYHSLLKEAYLIGKKKGVNLKEDVVEEHFYKFLYELNEDATSSLRRDIDAKRANELEIFCGYLLKQGKQFGLELPVTKYFYDKLKNF